MVFGKITTYIVTCTKCDWIESYPVNESLPNILSHLPKECPRCGAKTKNKKSPVDLWQSWYSNFELKTITRIFRIGWEWN